MGLGEIVARNLRRLREERELSQDELGSRAGVTRNYVGMIERRESSPSIDVIEKLAKALGVHPMTLFDEAQPGKR
jgi:transcriptional regulator with XRE-family HTH domain